MDLENRLRRCKFRAWHRGTREADYMIGCFFDARIAAGTPDDRWFEALLNEEDVDVMAWALGTASVPSRYAGAMMDAMQSWISSKFRAETGASGPIRPHPMPDFDRILSAKAPLTLSSVARGAQPLVLADLARAAKGRAVFIAPDERRCGDRRGAQHSSRPNST
jgi:antitoxin CptB